MRATFNQAFFHTWTKRLAASALVVVALLAITAAARADAELYQARTIVTGQGEESRLWGFAICLADVLVKVSGDPRLIGDPRVAKLSEVASQFVARFDYRDRLEGIPIHDEQGSRDRPYDLTVSFELAKVDAALHSLGRVPWGGKRPHLAVLIAVRLGTTTYMLASDGSKGIDQRDSLAAASWQMGMPIVLPSENVLADAGVTTATLLQADKATLDAITTSLGGDIALTGALVWDKGSLGWAGDWSLISDGTPHHWRIRDVNFDDAFRSAVRGAAQILSGNGVPE